MKLIIRSTLFFLIMGITIFLTFAPVSVWVILLFDSNFIWTIEKVSVIIFLTTLSWVAAYAYYQMLIDMGNNIALIKKHPKKTPDRVSQTYIDRHGPTIFNHP